jgi:hypothetical protein
MTRKLLRSHVNFVRLLARCQRDTALLHNKDANDITLDRIELAARLDSLDVALELLARESARVWALPSNVGEGGDDNGDVAAPTRAQLATLERSVKQLRENDSAPNSNISVNSAVDSSVAMTTTTTTLSSTTTSTTTEVVSSSAPSVSDDNVSISARDELLGVRNRRRAAQRAAVDEALSSGQIESQLAEQEKLQTMYKRELARMAAVLKEAALQQSTVVKGGNAMIDDLNDSVAENRERIIAENKRLKEHTDKWTSGVLFYWLVLVFAAVVFIGMVIFMKIVPK